MSEVRFDRSLVEHLQKEVNRDFLKVINDYFQFHVDLKEVQSYLFMSSHSLSNMEEVINEAIDYLKTIQIIREKINNMDSKYCKEIEKNCLTLLECLSIIHDILIRLKKIEREASQQLYEINQIYDYNLINGLKIGKNARVLGVKIESLYKELVIE